MQQSHQGHIIAKYIQKDKRYSSQYELKTAIKKAISCKGILQHSIEEGGSRRRHSTASKREHLHSQTTLAMIIFPRD